MCSTGACMHSCLSSNREKVTALHGPSKLLMYVFFFFFLTTTTTVILKPVEL